MGLTLPFNGTAFPWRRSALERLIDADDGEGLSAFLQKHPAAATWCKSFGKHEHSYLHEAAIKGRPAAFEALLKAGAQTGGYSQWGDVLLELALGMGRDAEACAPEGSQRMADMLLQNGMNIEGLNKSGRTAFLESCAQGNEGAARFLLARGAKSVVSAPSGMTPLMYVLQWADRPQLMEMVLETKPNVNLQNEDGMTALFYAWSAEQARRLIEAGANPLHKDKHGRTAESAYRGHLPRKEDLAGYATQLDANAGEAAQERLEAEFVEGAHAPVKASPMKPLSFNKKS